MKYVLDILYANIPKKKKVVFSYMLQMMIMMIMYRSISNALIMLINKKVIY